MPASCDLWLNGLGKATRKNIKRYLNRFEQAFPDFRYGVIEGAAVRTQLLHAIMTLNRLRMAAKGKVSGGCRRGIAHAATGTALRETRLILGNAGSAWLRARTTYSAVRWSAH